MQYHFGILLAAAFVVAQGGASVGGKTSPDGRTEIACDLPGPLHLRNVGGRDGAGLCVFTSISHAARYQNVGLLEDFRDYMRQYPGGGWPEKVDQFVAKIAQERGTPKPDYIQVQGGRETLDVIRAALDSGRMVSVTYAKSPTGRYGGARIAHMVNCVHFDGRHAVILDNNYIEPKDAAYEWMSVDQFVATFTGGRSGWAVILLDPGPPPFPYTKGE